jgi:transposase
MSHPTARFDSNAYSEALLVSLELSKSRWLLCFGAGVGGRRRRVSVRAWDGEAFESQCERGKQKLGLAADCRVVSCYEAGRDGFSVHRYLESLGFESLVIDTASCQVSRHRRRVKSDRIDAEMLLDHLERYLAGQRNVWRVVRVPSAEAEDRRHLHRELDTVKQDRTRSRNRISSLLALHGLRVKVTPSLREDLTKLRLWDGRGLPAGLLERLQRECDHLSGSERSKPGAVS